MINILVYVQHLLGIGHLHRSALITQALAQNGFDVTVVSGGMSEPTVDFGNVNFIQLSAVKTDISFTNLYDETGQVIDDDFKQARCAELIAIYNKVNPDAVLIETYPFGRRQMRFELLPLLDKIKNTAPIKPFVFCSIRDVIQPKNKQNRIDEIVDLVDDYFDSILVHGNKSFIRFDQTFPQAKQFAGKLSYTGYVCKEFITKNIAKNSQGKSILVSAGGGAVGQTIYQTAIEAANLMSGTDYQWHLLVGNNVHEEEFAQLVAQQADNLIIERSRSDFLDLMSNCFVSISQAGYNTIMDILITATQSIVIPFEGESEKEQLIRASKLEKNGILSVIREKDLSATSLLESVFQLGPNPKKHNLPINIDGAERTASLIKKILSSKTTG